MEEKTYGQENFSLPHDVVELPSGGRYYKNKKKSVKVGYLTANDENILVNISKNGGEGIITQLIRNKLYESDLKPENLLNGDLETILIFLRNTSFGADYTFNLTDPETGKSFQKVITLDELEFIKPETEPDDNGLFSVTLPKSNRVVKIRPLTYGDTMEMDKMAEKYPANMVPPRVTWKLQKMIVELDGTNSKEEINKFINDMPIMDSKFISNFIRNNEPRVNLVREIIAPSGRKVETSIAFGAEFFRPFF